MKIKMKSIHANIINETVSASATDVRAQIEIGYSHDEKIDCSLIIIYLQVSKTVGIYMLLSVLLS